MTDPQLQARGMIADHWDERIGRNVKGPGVVPVLSETPGTIRYAGFGRPGQHNDEVYGDLLGTLRRRARRAAGGGGAVTTLPEHVTIREVCLRDGLQIEEPITLAAKLELLEAVVATGVREIEATAFVSPSKVPALADAAALAAELPRFGSRTTSSSPRWWRAQAARPVRSPRAWARSSTSCRPPTATARPTSGGRRPTPPT